MPDNPTPTGPLFGPDAVTIDIHGSSNEVAVAVYPDASNAELKAAGQATAYYLQPGRPALATRANTPGLDFSMTAMVENAATSAATRSGAAVDFVGGTCTTTMCFTIPDSITTEVIAALAGHDYDAPSARLAPLFNYERSDPPPSVQIVPVRRSTVSCSVATPSPVPSPVPAVMTLQHGGPSAIQIPGRSTVLVSCNGPATEQIVTNLRNGSAPPFLLTYTLSEQFDTGATTMTADIAVDAAALYADFADAIVAGSASVGTAVADSVYQGALATGVIRICLANGAGEVTDGQLVGWMKGTDTMKTAALTMVAPQLFDMAAPTRPADASWWGVLCDGAAATLKATGPVAGLSRQSTPIGGAVSAQRVLTADFDDLAAAAKVDLDTYLRIVDIGAFG